MLSDILPTGLEVGVLNGGVTPASTVAIIGAGPIGLAALLTAQMYTPSVLAVIDKDPGRLEVAKRMGATHTFSPDKGDLKEQTKDLHGEMDGFDVVIEVCRRLTSELPYYGVTHQQSTHRFILSES